MIGSAVLPLVPLVVAKSAGIVLPSFLNAFLGNGITALVILWRNGVQCLRRLVPLLVLTATARLIVPAALLA